MPSPRLAFAAWKAREGLTDEQIAARLRERVESVSRQTVGAILSGERNAGGELAIALSSLTGLPVEHFIVPSSEAA